MVLSDVITMAVVALILVILCGLLFKEFKLLSFDPGFAKGIGLPVAALDQFMMFLIVVAVVVGIQAVGVVLMSALLITPAVSARYWTEKLGVMVVLSGIFGAISGFVGTLVSGSAATCRPVRSACSRPRRSSSFPCCSRLREGSRPRCWNGWR